MCTVSAVANIPTYAHTTSMGCGASKEESAAAPVEVAAVSPPAAKTTSAAKPTLNYFSICGRGETARLICAVGGLEFEDKAWAPAFDETGGWRQGYQAIGNAFGFPGTMPVLEHGELKLFETTAIESYLASLSPKFASLTPAQKAKDMMFQCIKADINVPTENVLFKKITGEELVPILEKWYPMIEGLLPESGFINGLAFPTPGDLAVTVMTVGCMPFQAGPAVAGYKFLGKYPKMERIAKACMEYGPMAKFLAASEHKTLQADPFGIMPKDATPEAPAPASGAPMPALTAVPAGVKPTLNYVLEADTNPAPPQVSSLKSQVSLPDLLCSPSLPSVRC